LNTNSVPSNISYKFFKTYLPMQNSDCDHRNFLRELLNFCCSLSQFRQIFLTNSSKLIYLCKIPTVKNKGRHDGTHVMSVERCVAVVLASSVAH
jgi:hypothetical protein